MKCFQFKTGFRALAAVLVAIWATHPVSALACAACYGQSDSPMAHGFNWGIISLLAVVICVLAAISSFFVFLARRAAAFQQQNAGTVGQTAINHYSEPVTTH
jgi:hypothetical protein